MLMAQCARGAQGSRLRDHGPQVTENVGHFFSVSSPTWPRTSGRGHGMKLMVRDKILDSGSDEATSAEGASARRSARHGANARAEICRRRGKHGIYGDERGC